MFYRSWEDEDAVNKIDRSISIIQSKATLVFNKFKKCFNCQVPYHKIENRREIIIIRWIVLQYAHFIGIRLGN